MSLCSELSPATNHGHIITAQKISAGFFSMCIRASIPKKILSRHLSEEMDDSPLLGLQGRSEQRTFEEWQYCELKSFMIIMQKLCGRLLHVCLDKQANLQHDIARPPTLHTRTIYALSDDVNPFKLYNTEVNLFVVNLTYFVHDVTWLLSCEYFCTHHWIKTHQFISRNIIS